VEDLAEMLGHNPVRIYEYVRNNFDYEPYYGSVKGSQETIREEAGNDVDLASLLISLYRASGIPARYAYGQVTLPIDQAMNIVGVEDEQTAGNVFASGGVPSLLIREGGNLTKLQLEHVWVEAYIPYSNYRGKIRDESGRTWIPLDPSFKLYEYHEPIVNLTEAMGLNATAFLEGMIGQSTIDPANSYITGMNQSYIQEQMSQYTNNTLDYLETTGYSNATLNDILGHRENIKEELGILPNSLPYKSHKLAIYSEIPDYLRHKIKFEIYGNSITLSMPELAGHRITLSYLPATEDDAAIIEEYGGITDVPAYLVEMKPVLRVEGELRAIGNAETLGETQQFVMEFQMPNGERDRVANDVTVGAYYAVGLNVGKVPLRLVEERRAKLSQWTSLVESGLINSTSSDNVAGEILYSTAISYFAQSDIFDDIIAKRANVVKRTHVSENIVGLNTDISYLFWSPVSFDLSGLFVDVDRHVYSGFGKDGDVNSTRTFMQASGQIGSALEHSIFEQLFNVSSVSAMRVLQIANAEGVPIYTINENNINEILPKLQLPSSIKEGIRNSVDSGMIVTVPERNVQLNNWHGAGWIVIDPTSGAGAYMISGGLAGGSWTEDFKCAAWAISFVLAFINPEFGGSLLSAMPWIGVFLDGIGTVGEGDFVNAIVGILLAVGFALLFVGFNIAFGPLVAYLMVLMISIFLKIFLGGIQGKSIKETFRPPCFEES
jgi:transglutaminase-like putative cysteine protease